MQSVSYEILQHCKPPVLLFIDIIHTINNILQNVLHLTKLWEDNFLIIFIPISLSSYSNGSILK